MNRMDDIREIIHEIMKRLKVSVQSMDSLISFKQ